MILEKQISKALDRMLEASNGRPVRAIGVSNYTPNKAPVIKRRIGRPRGTYKKREAKPYISKPAQGDIGDEQ